jgi:F-type H+-transporting ATPase subunit a
MMSGHSLLKILISFAWIIVWLNFSIFYISILPMVVVFTTIALEFTIAFLQAYVYMILVSIYLNDAINLH